MVQTLSRKTLNIKGCSGLCDCLAKGKYSIFLLTIENTLIKASTQEKGHVVLLLSKE
jgi:hypothetical protein